MAPGEPEGNRKLGPCPERDNTAHNPVKIQHASSSLKTAWGIRRDFSLLITDQVLEWQGCWGDFFKNKRANGSHFHLLSFILDTQTPVRTRVTTNLLPNLLTMCPTSTFSYGCNPSTRPHHQDPSTSDTYKL